mmetsp:Transcript_24034/g.68886  ORF Transcript_24034/g.68886 Transcript_24034/m.68886 type:complete len:210 (-) Transcript_24034:274-903(-)
MARKVPRSWTSPCARTSRLMSWPCLVWKPVERTTPKGGADSPVCTSRVPAKRQERASVLPSGAKMRSGSAAAGRGSLGWGTDSPVRAASSTKAPPERSTMSQGTGASAAVSSLTTSPGTSSSAEIEDQVEFRRTHTGCGLGDISWSCVRDWNFEKAVKISKLRMLKIEKAMNCQYPSRAQRATATSSKRTTGLFSLCSTSARSGGAGTR